MLLPVKNNNLQPGQKKGGDTMTRITMRGLAHKTWAETNGNQTRIIYYETAIVTFNNDEIILYTGGWWTWSTKDRMNRASKYFKLGYTVSWKGKGENKQWYVTYQGAKHEFNNEKIRLDRKTGKMTPV